MPFSPQQVCLLTGGSWWAWVLTDRHTGTIPTAVMAGNVGGKRYCLAIGRWRCHAGQTGDRATVTVSGSTIQRK
jgi:hypothetical protein